MTLHVKWVKFHRDCRLSAGARIGAYLAPLTFGLSLPTLSAMGSVIGAARASIGELRKEQ